MPKNLVVPDLPVSKKINIRKRPSYVEKHLKVIMAMWKTLCFLQIIEARKWLKDFIDKRFDKFGPTQDFVKQGEDFMSHFCLSTSINIGLLNPLEIIEEIKVKSKVPLNSFEGYIRQLERIPDILTYL